MGTKWKSINPAYSAFLVVRYWVEFNTQEHKTMSTHIEKSEQKSNNLPQWSYSGDIGGDVFDIRDLIAKVEELEGERDMLSEQSEVDEWNESDEGKELAFLLEFLDEVKGRGGDEQWRGDWYPVGFINNSYFTEYAMELLKDICDLPNDIPHYIAIDEEKTAENIQQDYSSVDFNGETYWYR
jgi:hypothetical protein